LYNSRQGPQAIGGIGSHSTKIPLAMPPAQAFSETFRLLPALFQHDRAQPAREGNFAPIMRCTYARICWNWPLIRLWSQSVRHYPWV